MAATVLDYALQSELAIGQGHPTLPRTIDRALRSLISRSGLDPDSPFTGLLPVFNTAAYTLTGSGDESAKIQAAINDAAAAGGGTVYIHKSCTATGLVVTSSNVWIVLGPGVVVSSPSTATMVQFNGTLTTKTTLGADAALGTKSLQVGSSAGFSIGDYVLIQSDARITTATLPHLVEINRVSAIPDGTHITLKRPVRNAYASASTVHVDLLTPLVNAGVQGGMWQQATGTSGDAVRFQYCIDPIARSAKARNFGDFGFYSYFCQGTRFEDLESYEGSDTGTPGGWCIAMHCTSDFYLGFSLVRDHPWDGIDIAGGSMYGTIEGNQMVNMGDAGMNLGHGQRCHHITVKNNHAIGCAPGFQVGSGTYAGDDDIVMDGNTDMGCSAGLIIQQDSARIKVAKHRSLKPTAQNFYVNSTTAVEVEFLECTGDSGGSNGLVANSKVVVRGGLYRSATGHGVVLNNAAAAGSLIEDVKASENTGDGIHVAPATSVTVLRPRTWGNGGYGVNNNNANDSLCEVRDHMTEPGKTADTSGRVNWSISTTHRINTGATPTVSAGRWTTAYAGAQAVTKLLGLAEGEIVEVLFGEANVTFQHNAAPTADQMFLKGGANLTGVNKTVRLQRRSGVLYEI